MATIVDEKSSAWVGWVYFAGILMIIRSFFQGLFGIVALTHATFYVATEDKLAVFNYPAWGWIHIALAVVLFTAGFSVLTGGLWGRIIGVIMVSLSILANLAFLPAYPIWCTLALIIDGLVLYALVVHGRDARIADRDGKIG